MSDSNLRGPHAVEVRIATAPDGTSMVLLQIPDGYMLLSAGDARRVGASLVAAAAELVNLHRAAKQE